MRSIGTLHDATAAATFGDYLYSKGIECQVEDEGDGTHSIWIIEDDQMPQASEYLHRFTTDPAAPEFRDVSKAAQKKRAKDEREEERRRSTVATEERMIYERNTWMTPFLTTSLIFLCIVAAILTNVGQNRRLDMYFYFFPALIHRGEVWRLISPIFLHFGYAHIIFNLYGLYILGSLMEQRLGKWLLLLFVLATGIASNYAQYLWAGPIFGGMSGVVYAMFGFVWMRSKYGRDPLYDLDEPTVLYSIAWLFLCMTGWVGDIANTAHVVGLLAGMAVGFATKRRFGN